MARTFTSWTILCGLALGGMLWCGSESQSAEVIRRADERFASEEGTEVPSLQRHVLPLMGRLGCNGRACHGSFQGQGGFRLSLFGYDFKTDHEAIVKGDAPRVDLKKVSESLILSKPSSDDPDEHGGGKRMDVKSWQYRLIRKWVEAGAPEVNEDADAKFVKMVVTPTEIVFKKAGETATLNVVAHWSDGTIEDVTPLCRFQTNDDGVAKVDVDGTITALDKGDTHIVAFYDNGVVPVSVLLPVSENVGPKDPSVATKTKVDELVVNKLRKLGIMPAELCTDGEFLRRASLDITGQLPTADEVKTFLADQSSDKRSRKVDELLQRPAFSAWWATKLSDVLGNSENQLKNNPPPMAGEHWYRWLNARLLENEHYDDIVERIVMATSRSSEGQTFEEYCAEITSYVRKDNPADFTDRETMPYYWMRQNMRLPNEKALSFSYAFLGVRLQCAECHKHPFDQWSQSDFQHFTAFFNRITSGPADKEAEKAMIAKLNIKTDPKDGGNKLRQELYAMALEGTVVPFNEVYIRKSGAAVRGNKDKAKLMTAGRVITPKVLGGEEAVDKNYDDPRQPLMDWLRQKDNPYFARSFVNRVWAHYFNVGIVEPADDMNLANAPSNKELLDYLADAFIEHDYDIRWLMREIVSSDTYQRSWETNATNELDLRNFSRNVPRRLQAEVVYDAVVSATAGQVEIEQRRNEPVDRCSIGLGQGYTARKNGGATYALGVFGKPKRETPCDCERSNEPSLLQTVYLRNDQEIFNMITRRNGWFHENLAALGAQQTAAVPVTNARGNDTGELKNQIRYVERSLAEVTDKIQKLKKQDKKTTAAELKSLRASEARLEARLAEFKKDLDQKSRRPSDAPAEPVKTAALGPAELVTQAYLRTFSRYPTDSEVQQAEEYLQTSTDLSVGMRDLIWALLNSKEFVVNH